MTSNILLSIEDLSQETLGDLVLLDTRTVENILPFPSFFLGFHSYTSVARVFFVILTYVNVRLLLYDLALQM